MQANALCMTVTKVVELLGTANIASVVNQYRAAQGNKRAEALDGLRQAADIFMEQFASMSASERQITKIMHLDSLGSQEYWSNLFGSSEDPKKHKGEIVRLASRIMFASNHLPALLSLVDQVDTTPQFATQALKQGDGYLCIRLTDAGERASDPDRVARSIDGIDMLYSACASIARKPAIDIRVDSVTPRPNGDRDVVFAGEGGSIAAVYAIINSIRETLAELDPVQEIDLDSVVWSLPIFEDLNTLASLGNFSKQDLKDISDTLHQGALLTLESGVISLDPSETVSLAEAAHGAAPKNRATSSASGEKLALVSSVDANGAATEDIAPFSPVERDEHYDRYLKEREAMLGAQEGDGSELTAGNHTANASEQGEDTLVDKNRKDAVDDLLKSLGQSRDH
ncbi:MAG: hypothetical protein ACI9UN_004919 [Granulosicoccus sp.]|jgi:hypothetical protein